MNSNLRPIHPKGLKKLPAINTSHVTFSLIDFSDLSFIDCPSVVKEPESSVPNIISNHELKSPNKKKTRSNKQAGTSKKNKRHGYNSVLNLKPILPKPVVSADENNTNTHSSKVHMQLSGCEIDINENTGEKLSFKGTLSYPLVNEEKKMLTNNINYINIESSINEAASITEDINLNFASTTDPKENILLNRLINFPIENKDTQINSDFAEFTGKRDLDGKEEHNISNELYFDDNASSNFISFNSNKNGISDELESINSVKISFCKEESNIQKVNVKKDNITPECTDETNLSFISKLKKMSHNSHSKVPLKLYSKINKGILYSDDYNEERIIEKMPNIENSEQSRIDKISSNFENNVNSDSIEKVQDHDQSLIIINQKKSKDELNLNESVPSTSRYFRINDNEIHELTFISSELSYKKDETITKPPSYQDYFYMQNNDSSPYTYPLPNQLETEMLNDKAILPPEYLPVELCNFSNHSNSLESHYQINKNKTYDTTNLKKTSTSFESSWQYTENFSKSNSISIDNYSVSDKPLPLISKKKSRIKSEAEILNDNVNDIMGFMESAKKILNKEAIDKNPVYNERRELAKAFFLNGNQNGNNKISMKNQFGIEEDEPLDETIFKQIEKQLNEEQSSESIIIKYTPPKVKKKYLCQICGKMLSRRSSLYSHFAMHKNSKEYKCPYCLKSFNYKRVRNIHIRIHTNERRYKCKICSCTFRTNSALSKHRFKHTNERPHECAICNKTFKTKSVLKQHYKSHEFGPFSCHQCGKVFNARKSLAVHKVSHKFISKKMLMSTKKRKMLVMKPTPYPNVL